MALILGRGLKNSQTVWARFLNSPSTANILFLKKGITTFLYRARKSSKLTWPGTMESRFIPFFLSIQLNSRKITLFGLFRASLILSKFKSHTIKGLNNHRARKSYEES